MIRGPRGPMYAHEAISQSAGRNMVNLRALSHRVFTAVIPCKI